MDSCYHFLKGKVSDRLSPPVGGIWALSDIRCFGKPKTLFLSVSLGPPKIHFSIFIFSDFFSTKNIFFVFQALKIIIFPNSVKPVFILDMVSLCLSE